VTLLANRSRTIAARVGSRDAADNEVGETRMTKQQFLDSLNETASPQGLSPYLAALWLEHSGDWAKAHETVQDISDTRAALVHAYLHRKEGDQSNASYWYGKAAKTFPSLSLEEEWDELVERFLSEGQ